MIFRQEKKEKTFPWKPFKVAEVDCARLFSGDEEEFNHSIKIVDKLPRIPTMESISSLAKNCSVFRKENGFIMSSLTKEERKFPIAYSILVFKDAYQVLFSGSDHDIVRTLLWTNDKNQFKCNDSSCQRQILSTDPGVVRICLNKPISY